MSVLDAECLCVCVGGAGQKLSETFSRVKSILSEKEGNVYITSLIHRKSPSKHQGFLIFHKVLFHYVSSEPTVVAGLTDPASGPLAAAPVPSPLGNHSFTAQVHPAFVSKEPGFLSFLTKIL